MVCVFKKTIKRLYNAISIIKQDGLSLNLTNGKVYCDSRELAKQFGKRHDHVLRSIAKEVERFNLLKNGEIKKVDEYFKKSEYVYEIDLNEGMLHKDAINIVKHFIKT